MLDKFKNIKELQELLKQKLFSVSDLVEAYLTKIDEEAKQYNDLIAVLPELARAQAARLDEKIEKGEKLGKLAGVVLVIKDNILVKNYYATAGSKILSNYRASYNATVIERLQAEDAIIIAKGNMDEFACGSTNTTSYFGPVINPLNQHYVPGGSSGGSAAAVVAQHCLAALGSDTGGSVRQPASFCGIVGLKPTYGAVSRNGVIAMASSFDQIGPLANNVADVFTVYSVIQGKDKKDQTTIDYKFELAEKINEDLSDLTIAIVPEYFAKTDNEAAYLAAVEKLKEAGANITEVKLEWSDLALAVYYILQPAELSSNLARFDGIRYGDQSMENDLNKVYEESRGQGFGAEIKRRIILGTYVLSASYYDAYYKKARQVRALIKNEYKELFEKVDLLFLPTSPGVALKMQEEYNPLKLYLEDVFTVVANVAGIPALSLPIARTADNLAYGGQLMAAWQREDLLQRVGQVLETKIHNI